MADATAYMDLTATTGAVAVRELESAAGTSFVNGANVGGSNAPGLGIDISVAASQPLIESADSWTLLDQWGAARTPQDGSYIGNTGLGDGTEGLGTTPVLVVIPDDDVLDDIGIGTVTLQGDATLTSLALGWTI